MSGRYSIFIALALVLSLGAAASAQSLPILPVPEPQPFPAISAPVQALAWAAEPDETGTPGGGPTSTEPTGPAREEPTAESSAEPPANQQAAPKSDAEKQKALAAAAAAAYKGMYYDNQFDYLLDPAYRDWHLGESLKRNCVGGVGVLDIGGEYRARYHHEQNMRGLSLTGRDDDFLLHRTRLYGNLELGDRVRIFAEMIDATSEFEDFAPRLIEENRADMLNLFGDYMLLDGGNGELWVRAGRQELLYGAQRTVSPLDWANTRRTFEGYKMFWRGADWDIDAFWVRPMNLLREEFDTPDQSQQFTGIYSTYKGVEKQKFDLYYLYLGEDDAPTAFQFNTAGLRWEAEYGRWLVETEMAYQFGEYGAADHSEGAFTIGLGRKLAGMPWKPVLWAYYDWASGDEVIGNGYHHLFPLGHRYLGYMDLFGRRNIQDLNFLLTAKPKDRLTLTAWWHMFWLQDRDDVPYTVTMAPEVPTPGGSKELGQEIDLVADWAISPRQNLLLGYSHFFSGDFYSTNPSPPVYDGDADFFYTQYSLRF